MAEQTASLQAPENTQDGPAAINPWFIAVTVTIAAFMELLDTSMPTSRCLILAVDSVAATMR
jgi:hypothetical protein